MSKVSKRIKLNVASVEWRGEVGEAERTQFAAVYPHLSDAAWRELQLVIRRYSAEINLYQGATIKEVETKLDKVHRAIKALQDAVEEADTPETGFATSAGVVRYFQDRREDPAPDLAHVASAVQAVLERTVEGEVEPIADEVADTLWGWITDGRLPGARFHEALEQYDEAIVHIRLNPGEAEDPHASFLLNLTDWAKRHSLPHGASKKDEPLPLVRLAEAVRGLVPRELRPAPVTAGSLGKQILALRKARAAVGDKRA